MSVFLRAAASGWIPPQWFLKELPNEAQREARTGRLHIEIVSHCWNYAHLLTYQLSSLIRFPPTQVDITMTVFYSDEDKATCKLLDYFGTQIVPGVSWNWQKLPRSHLFRRGIGRNLAARNTAADWIWFTDCDLMFREQCLDTLNSLLQGRRDALVYPHFERVTSLLAENDPMLQSGAEPQIVDINTDQFALLKKSRATGPLQITHGDVARACGYCECLPLYQTPSEVWCKAYEDRAFRWLLRTQGTPLEIPGVYRIRHISKGRYTGNTVNTGIRSRLRRTVAWLTDPK